MSIKSFCVGLAPIVVLGGLAGATLFGSSNSALAEIKSLSAQCEVLKDRSVKGLAIEQSYSNATLCACAGNDDELRRQLGASGVNCPLKRNFNLPQTTSVSPNPEPNPNPNPDPDNSGALQGNNGWGNQGEGENPGSDEGKQASSKDADDDGKGDR